MTDLSYDTHTIAQLYRDRGGTARALLAHDGTTKPTMNLQRHKHGLPTEKSRSECL